MSFYSYNDVFYDHAAQVFLSHPPARLRAIVAENTRLAGRLATNPGGQLSIAQSCETHDRVHEERTTCSIEAISFN